MSASIQNLSKSAVQLLETLVKGPTLVPYGDPTALELILADFAHRQTSFGKLQITAKGRAALQTKGGDRG